ncbi:endothelin-converting enzyme homolog [Biomphalaria glabrata]|uniref:Endothelin-converting enzyme homolog n=1 Tax=Biomphalaria glabrata TaxID=6526 RepID=A0A9W2ZRJ6_BIOGL|nr:endothelin-converting enzyme homolog [Biomphalaria glabrata]
MISFRKWVFFFLVSYHVTTVAGMVLPENKTQRACQTEDCRLGQHIAGMMNRSVDPCEDMYQFSCGGWLRDNPLPEKRKRLMPMDKTSSQIDEQLIQLFQSNDTTYKGNESTAIRKVKKLYRICKDRDSIYYKGNETLLKLIEELGSWTVTSTLGEWNETSWSLQKALEKSHSLWGKSFWSISVSKDVTNGTRYILYLRQNGIINSNPNNYNDTELKEKFLNKTVSNAAILGGEEERARDKMEEVFELHFNLSKIFVPTNERENPLNLVNKMTLREFQNLLGSWIDIEQYFSAFHDQKFLTKDDEMIVKDPNYFKKLKDIMEKTNKEVLANYIVYDFIEKALPYLPSKPFNGSTEFRSDKKCLDLISSMMGLAVSALYLENRDYSEITPKVQILFDNIREQFVQELVNQNSTDSQTKSILIAKAKSTTIRIGFPDFITDSAKLDHEFEDLEIVETNFLDNFVRVNSFGDAKIIKNYRGNPEPSWSKNLHETNAYYDSLFNQVTILAGLLQEPFVSLSYPDAYLYGLIGTVIGHELLHGFSGTLIFIDANGHVGDFWAKNFTETFQRKSKCLIDQFDSYIYNGHNLKGKLSLGETTSDNSGMKYSFKAYKNAIKSNHSLPYLNLTDEQLFFVGWSQFWCGHYDFEKVKNIFIENSVHPISQFRVYSTMSNSEDFSKTFQCSENATLNPDNKCSVW